MRARARLSAGGEGTTGPGSQAEGHLGGSRYQPKSQNPKPDPPPRSRLDCDSGAQDPSTPSATSTSNPNGRIWALANSAPSLPLPHHSHFMLLLPAFVVQKSTRVADFGSEYGARGASAQARARVRLMMRFRSGFRGEEVFEHSGGSA